MKSKQELRERIRSTREACKWDDSVDNLLDYQAAVEEYNTARAHARDRNAARRERNEILRDLSGTSARAAREDMGLSR